jgi:peptidoglycan/LPS O-acetylase OafA/YrhL
MSAAGPIARPAPSNPRFDYFDSLRAVAVVAILVHHIAFYMGGQFTAWYGALSARLGVGVTLFFLISGFLLYRPYAVSMLGGPPSPTIGVYARRRALRILPAYWIALTLLAIWPGLTGVFTSEWWVQYALLQSNRLAWIFHGLHPAWSLSVEAAFYVVLPALALALGRLGRGFGPSGRVRLQLFVLAGLGAAGLAYRGWIFHQNELDLRGTLPSFFFWFAVGMSVAVASAWWEGRESEGRTTAWLAAHPGACWALAAAVFLGASWSSAFPRPFSKELYTTASYCAEHVVYALIALLVMLPAVFGEQARGLPRRVMGTRPFRFLGQISYGIFLWHDPLFGALQLRGASNLIPGLPFLSLLLAGMPVILVCAWLSWRLVEKPAIAISHGRRPVRKADAARSSGLVGP